MKFLHFDRHSLSFGTLCKKTGFANGDIPRDHFNLRDNVFKYKITDFE